MLLTIEHAINLVAFLENKFKKIHYTKLELFNSMRGISPTLCLFFFTTSTNIFVVLYIWFYVSNYNNYIYYILKRHDSAQIHFVISMGAIIEYKEQVSDNRGIISILYDPVCMPLIEWYASV